ncbi:DUF937 domain-containing protein [Bryobacter aggregatus]|uniref:DUF937 domain-containing protein n=1 Tax=Bryobacter aggregatus TaxID=360054 RepID=UPI00138E3E73|nr:DUF937 domain-containing protein [Bryobacter aggregatus]
MNLLDLINNANGGQSVQALAERFGISGDQAQGVLSQLVPALAHGVNNNVSQEGGLQSLLGALAGGNHAQYVDDPNAIAQPEAVDEGNGILSHVLGSKDASTALAQHVAGNTGVSDSVIKQMLPLVASMAMGVMAKRMMSGGASSGTDGQAAAATPESGLAGMLNFNQGGGAVSEVIGLVGKFFSH